jgi:hypothetical protein
MNQEALLPTQATTNKKNIKKRHKCPKCEYTTCSAKKMGRHVAQEYDLVLEEGKWTMREFTRTGAWVEQQRKLTEKVRWGIAVAIYRHWKPQKTRMGQTGMILIQRGGMIQLQTKYNHGSESFESYLCVSPHPYF